MNNTIQVRHRRAMQASLCQQRPSELIYEVETRERASEHRGQPSLFYGGECVYSVSTSGSAPIEDFMTGSTGMVVLIEADHPTGGSTVLNDEEAGNRTKSEWNLTVTSSWARWAEMTKELLQRHEPNLKPMPSAAARVRVDRLTQIQTAFGLPVLVLAEILGITRQGLYKWLDATKEITLQESSRQRLAIIERLAKLWAERTKAPLSSVAHEPVEGERTVLQILTDAELDEVSITNIFDKLIEKLQGKTKSLSQRMADAGFSRRPSASTLPTDE